MLRFLHDVAIANWRWETDRDVVEFPVRGLVFQLCDEIRWPHFQSGIELALINALHHELYVCTADIDDQRLVHRTANFELLAQTDRLTETLENAFALLSGAAGAQPAFHDFEREEPKKCDAG